MALDITNSFPGKSTSASTNYPYGSARNVTVSGDGTGTPFVADLVNDIFGMQQSFLSAAGITPSGNPDKVGASQYLDALQFLMNVYPLAVSQNTGAALMGTSDGGNVQQNLDALSAGQIGGVIVFTTFTLLDAYAPANASEQRSSFKVTNDTDTSKNGYYHWISGTAYEKDAELANGIVEDGNVDATSGNVVFNYSVSKQSQYVSNFTDVEPYRQSQSNKNKFSPIAPVVILLGQSLNAARGTIAQSVASPNVKMLVAGCHVSSFDFWSANPIKSTNYTNVASTISLTEGGDGQSPCVGIANKILGANIERAYVGSVAVGARTLSTISTDGIKKNVYAFVHRLCELSRSEGYTPKVIFYSAHGEADAFAGTTEQDYFTRGIEYYKMCQLVAMQAMRDADYRAPVILSYPMQNSTTGATDNRTMARAISGVAKNLVNGIDFGSIYQWPMESDRTHPAPTGYVQRGEYVAGIIQKLLVNNFKSTVLEMIDVTLTGANVVAIFNDEVVQDLTMDAGTNLNTGFALDGFEYLDNGSFIAIDSIDYRGSSVLLTLASAPTGTTSQQQLRIASQTTTATLVVGLDNNIGSQVRKNNAGSRSIINNTQQSYDWAKTQTIGLRAI